MPPQGTSETGMGRIKLFQNASFLCVSVAFGLDNFENCPYPLPH